jgi:MFS family permease
MLALPTFALALSITMVSTYLSTITRRYTQQTVIIGVIIGGEGVMALWIPLIAGAWSDKLRTPIGGRLPFVLAGVLPAAAALALIGFVHSLGLVALVAAVFFAFYFVAYEPYRAMYPDLLDEESVAGRAQSTQALARGLGTGCALLAGGLLLSVARPLPFTLSAVILVAALVGFVLLILHHGLPKQNQDDAEGPAAVASPAPAAVQGTRRAAVVLHRQRAVGDGAGGSEGVRRPIRDDRSALHVVHRVADDRRRGAGDPDRRGGDGQSG